MCRFVTEDPVGSGGKPVKQSLRTQEINICERREEEHSLNARRETDQIEKEFFSILLCLKRIKALDRVYPLQTEFSLLADRRDILDRRKGLFAFVVVGNVCIKQSEIELYVQGLFIELTGKVHPGLGRIYMLVKI